MTTIAIAQEKGGNCKTTTSVNLAVLLNKKGHKTLLIDADQQANSTDTFQAEYEGLSTLYDCLIDGANPMDCIQHTEIGDIIAGDPLLQEAKGKLESKGIKGLTAFKEMVSKIKGYEYVIIDCPPDMSVYLQSVFIGSDQIIIPCLASRYSLKGINNLLETYNNIKVMNPTIKIKGFLLCKFSGRNNADKDILLKLYQIAQNLETKVFNTYVRETSKVREAEDRRVPITIFNEKCTASLDYNSFVDEYLTDN